MATNIFSKVCFFALITVLSGCERQVSYSGDVQPILKASCIECHDKSAEGYAASGFSLGDYDSVMKGTRFGPVVIANSSISSTLYLVIASKTSPEIHMPPHHDNAMAEGRGTRLSEHQIEIIQRWIDQGAQNN
jgi:Planctomycete cytochrome C